MHCGKCRVRCFCFILWTKSQEISVSVVSVLTILFLNCLSLVPKLYVSSNYIHTYIYHLYLLSTMLNCWSTCLTYSQGKNKGSPSPKPGCTTITPCSEERLNEESFKPKTEEGVRFQRASTAQDYCYSKSHNDVSHIPLPQPGGHLAVLFTYPVWD